MSDRLDRIESLLEATATTLGVTTTRLDQVTEGLNQVTGRLNQVTEGLDQVTEGLNQVTGQLNQVTERLNQVAEQQQRNTTDIDNLLGAISTTDVEVRAISQSVAANEQRFNILIQEMRADRRASQQAFQALLLPLANVNGRVDDLEAAG
ncbi:MAG: hypothetical protein WBA76_18440 [Phormidesmis sp.]